MFTSSAFFFSWFFILTLAGSVCFIVDRTVGVGVYRWFYGMTHAKPLPPDVERGFIYNRKAANRFSWAVLIALLQSALAAAWGASSGVQEVLSVLVEIPCLMVGFYCGPFVYRLWRGKEQVFERMDQIESGEISLGKEVRDISERAVNRLKDSLAHLPSAEETSEAVPEESSKAAPEEPELDPKALMDRYLKSGKE